MAADFAPIADFRTLLNFDEGSDLRFIANLATVKIYEAMNPHVSTKLYVWCNPSEIG
jgi:hypothetical protein